MMKQEREQQSLGAKSQAEQPRLRSPDQVIQFRLRAHIRREQHRRVDCPAIDGAAQLAQTPPSLKNIGVEEAQDEGDKCGQHRPEG